MIFNLCGSSTRICPSANGAASDDLATTTGYTVAHGVPYTGSKSPSLVLLKREPVELSGEKSVSQQVRLVTLDDG